MAKKTPSPSGQRSLDISQITALAPLLALLQQDPEFIPDTITYVQKHGPFIGKLIAQLRPSSTSGITSRLRDGSFTADED